MMTMWCFELRRISDGSTYSARNIRTTIRAKVTTIIVTTLLETYLDHNDENENDHNDNNDDKMLLNTYYHNDENDHNDKNENDHNDNN